MQPDFIHRFRVDNRGVPLRLMPPCDYVHLIKSAMVPLLETASDQVQSAVERCAWVYDDDRSRHHLEREIPEEHEDRMATADLSYIPHTANPVDLVEQIANGQDWSFDRSGEDELSLSVAGTWADYQISLNWRTDLETLHIACAFDFKVPDARMSEVYRLLAQINEQLWLGHFDLWTHEGLIIYRHGMMLNDTVATPGQCEALLHGALEACERYYQAFQFVVWAGKDAREALAGTMFETEGRA